MKIGEGNKDEFRQILRKKFTKTITRVKNLLKWSFSKKAFLDTNTADFGSSPALPTPK